MAADHYRRLGVRRDAGEEEIHDAYRRKAKAHHPDRSGQGDEARFRSIQEAYETLRDRERRRRYDESLNGVERASPTRARAVRPPPFEASAPWAARAQEARRRLELVLEPDEARRGGILPLSVPVEYPCPYCAGSTLARFLCPQCGGRGSTPSSTDVELRLPAGMRHGSTLEFRVDLDAMRSLRVLVDVLVEPS